MVKPKNSVNSAPNPTPRASEIHAALGKRGIARVDERSKFASNLLGREIRAFTDLSNEEADRLLTSVA
ncbi:MAG: hypothetical protein H7095_03590 [Pseudopedobacter sp.]|nr:hypothetical protein [Deinococcales bacterium]